VWNPGIGWVFPIPNIVLGSQLLPCCVFRHQILRLPATAGDIFFTQTFLCHTCLFFALSLLSLSTLFFKSVDMWSNSSRSYSKFNSILRIDNQIKFSSSAWDNILDMQVIDQMSLKNRYDTTKLSFSIIILSNRSIHFFLSRIDR